jgi:hypothetical protein
MSARVTFTVEWAGERTPRQLARLTEEERAAYARARAAAAPCVGAHTWESVRPFEQWTARDLDHLAAEMLRVVSQCEALADAGADPWGDHRRYVSVSRFNPLKGTHDRFGFRLATSGFWGDVDISPCRIPLPAIVAWIVSLDPSSFDVDWRRRPLGMQQRVEAFKSRAWRPGTPDPNPRGARQFNGGNVRAFVSRAAPGGDAGT